MAVRPNVSSESEKELDKVAQQFETFDKNVQDLTLDRMNKAPLKEVEPQTKLSSKELEKSKEIYLKPITQIGSKEKFNERYRNDYNFAIEPVRFIAENHEMIGEAIELWTKPFAGMAAQFWHVPVNKPVWGPRHLAEQLKKGRYHRLKMDETTTIASDGMGQYYGAMAVDHIIQRIDAMPVSTSKSIFMGAVNF